MSLPEALLSSLEGLPGYNKKTFESVHELAAPLVSIRYNPAKLIALTNADTPVPWASNAFYLNQRPSFTFDPLFHAGSYYVQEASSMIVEQALKQHTNLDNKIRVLDLCAAPGGKSTHLQSLINQESLLVSNEVIRSRANILKDNIIKWGAHNVAVTNNDPRDFNALPNFFDVILVDAPCSGSGLFRRDPDAMTEWSVNNVALCHQRQQRILADIWPSLKEDGLLIYSTCSFSKEEDEDILDWIVEDLKSNEGVTDEIQPLPIRLDPSWNILEVKTTSGAYGYRCWPDQVKGEGFFLACFRKKDSTNVPLPKIKKALIEPDKQGKKMIEEWIGPADKIYVQHLDSVYGWPLALEKDFQLILQELKLLYAGTLLGELKRNKLIPDHALALSDWTKSSIPELDLDIESAIRYLQRKDLDPVTGKQGWHLVKYKGSAIGWVNILPNRVNNYYPKELRILKDNN